MSAPLCHRVRFWRRSLLTLLLVGLCPVLSLADERLPETGLPAASTSAENAAAETALPQTAELAEVATSQDNTIRKESTALKENTTPQKDSVPTADTVPEPGPTPLDGETLSLDSEILVADSIPKAENIDLREVIDRPLHEVLPPQVDADAAAVVDVPAAEVAAGVAPLRLLGAEVPPGTATRLAWSVRDSLAGISVPTPVLVVHGTQPGPKVCLTAAVHGDELNGIEMVRRVLYNLQPDRLSGTVIGVPIVNVEGFRRASRYLPDRRDLNRFFPGDRDGSYASRIAHSFFHNVVRHCDYLVDLHTGSFHRTNLPQLRADLTHSGVAELSRNMGAIVVLHSEGAEGSLRRAATDAGIPAVTVEAGEPLIIDADAVQQGVLSVETLLSKLNMYAYRGLWARQTAPVYYKSLWVRVGAGGILLSQVRLGERISRNQVLGSVTDPITNIATEIRSPIAGRVLGMAVNQIMLPGYAAYHIGYQATAEEAAASTDAGPDDGDGQVPVGDIEDGEI